MDHRPKYKRQNFKIPKGQHKSRENLDDLGQGNDFIDSKGIIPNRNN